jgi:hypothetical protein
MAALLKVVLYEPPEGKAGFIYLVMRCAGFKYFSYLV